VQFKHKSDETGYKFKIQFPTLVGTFTLPTGNGLFFHLSEEGLAVWQPLSTNKQAEVTKISFYEKGKR